MATLVLKNGESIEILSYTDVVQFEGPSENCIQIFFPDTNEPTDLINNFNEIFTSDNISSIKICEENKPDVDFEIIYLVEFMVFYSDSTRSVEMVLRLKN